MVSMSRSRTPPCKMCNMNMPPHRVAALFLSSQTDRVVIQGKIPPKGEKGVSSGSDCISNAEQLDLSDTGVVHVSYPFAPLHEGDLDIVVALDADKVLVLVAIS